MSIEARSKKDSGLRQFADVLMLILLFYAVYIAITFGLSFAVSAWMPPYLFIPMCWVLIALAFFPTIKLWQFIKKLTSNWSFVAAALMIVMVAAGIIYGGNVSTNSSTDASTSDVEVNHP